METVFIIEVGTLFEDGEIKFWSTKVSQEAYKNIEDAKHFCKTRSDNPSKISEYEYESESHRYKIIEANVR